MFIFVTLTPLILYFFFNVPPTPEIYTFPYTTLFRSVILHADQASAEAVALPGEALDVGVLQGLQQAHAVEHPADRKSTRLNSSHMSISYAVFCLKKKNIT